MDYVLEDLLPYATKREIAFIEAVRKHGSTRKAARVLGINGSAIRHAFKRLRRRAAKHGLAPEAALTTPTAEGFSVRFQTTQYGPEGEVERKWIRQAPDEAARLEALSDAIATITGDFDKIAKPVRTPKHVNSDLLAVYPLGDPHIGMMSWAEETGNSFDLKIAERTLVGAVDKLVHIAEPAEQALIINLGDFFHADNSMNRTMRHGHPLDVDGRYPKVLRVGIRCMRRVIDRALEKHKTVRVICEIGNHDDHSSIMLALCLEAYYEREPRVEIDTSPDTFHWHRFDKNLIGTTHGDKTKLPDLPAIMAYDRKVDWGETDHRYWYVGHVHHDQRLERRAKDYTGCTVETFRTMAARDSYHQHAGYRAERDLKVDLLHRRYGRISRNTVGLAMVE